MAALRTAASSAIAASRSFNVRFMTSPALARAMSSSDDVEGRFKAMIMLKRKDGMSREDFATWWQGQHRGLAMKLPGLRKYAINLVNPPADGSEPDYDGVAELWFDREEDLLAAYATDAGKAVADDSLAVVSKRDRLLTTEYIYEP